MAYSQKKDDVYGSLTLYRELAYFIGRREEYERALRYFDEAVARAPTDKRALTGRAWARAKTCQYAGAIDDTKKALQQDPSDLIITAQKALNTYLCCEFEDALVLNLRMVPKRKKPDNFTMGVMHCTEAIENGIGKRAGRPLRDHFKIIRRLAWKKAREAEKPFEPKSKHKKKKKKKKKEPAKTKKQVREPVVPVVRSKASKAARSTTASIFSGASKATAGTELEVKAENLDNKSRLSATLSGQSDAYRGVGIEDLCIQDSLHSTKTESDFVPPGKPFPFRPMQRYTTNIENYMAEKYLDSMYLDKMFLKNLKYNLGVTSPNKQGSKRVLQLSKDGYKVLAYKQELLRTRRPFYFIKYQEARLSGALKARIEAELRKMQLAAKKDADGLIRKIRKSIGRKETRIALETAEKLKIFCDLKPRKVLPAREQYLEEMYGLVGQAYYQLFRLNESQFEWEQVKRIYNWIGLPGSREPSTDSVINQFKGVFIDWKKQITVYEDRLRKATTSEEMAWIYHELARYHTELKQFELARVYARKCIQEGHEADDVRWVINAMMALTRINMQQHNRNDAKTELNETLQIAKQIEDRTLIRYIEKALEVVERAEFDDYFGAKVLEKREKQIIQMMAGAGMKDEVAYLFRKMAVMPAARRMSVMPGVRLEDVEKPTATARKMSIMPTARTQTDTPPAPRAVLAVGKSSEKGEGGKEGVGFMELIKYHVD